MQGGYTIFLHSHLFGENVFATDTVNSVVNQKILGLFPGKTILTAFSHKK